MKSHLISIGNSRGVRIPKVWLEQLGLDDEVELAIKADCLMIRSGRCPRQGWEDEFRVMHARGDDQIVESSPPSAWEQAEGEW